MSTEYKALRYPLFFTILLLSLIYEIGYFTGKSKQPVQDVGAVLLIHNVIARVPLVIPTNVTHVWMTHCYFTGGPPDTNSFLWLDDIAAQEYFKSLVSNLDTTIMGESPKP